MAAIRVELELQSGQFTSRLIHAGESVRQFQANVGGAIASVNRVGNATRGLLGTLRDLTIVTGAFGLAIGTAQRIFSGWAGQIITVNANMQRLSALLQSMGTDSDPVAAAAENIRYLRDFALEVPFSLEAITNSFVKMRATGIDPLAGALQNFADGVAAAGGTDEMLNRATIAITQMSGKGVIQMEELRQQLGEAIPRAIELMARSMGVTYSDLVQQISTGRVLAEPALQALSLELNRTFGGAAQRQMETFVGMAQQTTTLLQNMALKIGEAGYFDEVENQLRDLNEFLGGDIGTMLSVKLGEALASIVRGLRNAVDWVVEFRQEIAKVGIILVATFAGRAVFAGFATITRFLAGMGAEMALLRVQTSLTGVAMSNAFTAWRLGMMGLAASAGGIGAVTFAFRSLAAVLPLVGAGLTFISAWILPLAAAIGIVALSFGLFSDKARDAWQELEQFGAQSMEQVQRAGELLTRQQDLVDQLRRDSEFRPGMSAAATVVAVNAGQQLIEEERKLAEMQVRHEVWRNDALEIEAQRAADREIDMLEDQVEVRRRAYDEQEIAAQQQLEADRRAATEAGNSVAAIEEAAQIAKRARDVAYYEEELRTLTGWYVNQTFLAENGDADQARVQTLARDRTIEMIRQVRSQLEILNQLPMGVSLALIPPDEENLLERGQTQLASIERTIAGLRAELRGGSGDVAEFMQAFEDGAYGPADTEQVIELRDKIIAAQEEFERLTTLLDGRKSFADDVLKVLRDSEEALFEARYGELTEVEKILLRASQGFYAGVGAGVAGYEDLIPGLVDGLNDTGTAAATAGTNIQDNAFGADSLAAGADVLTMITGINGAWASLNGTIGGTNIAGALNGGQGFFAAAAAGITTTASQLIRAREGYLDLPQWDVNHLRLGFGSDTQTAADGTVTEVTASSVETLAGAIRDLDRRIAIYERTIIGQIGPDRWESFTESQQAVLDSIFHNYGELPGRIMDEVAGGTNEEIAAAIRGLANDNNGINRGRRNQEADIWMGAAIPVPGRVTTNTSGAMPGVLPGQQAALEQAQRNIEDLARLTANNALQAAIQGIIAETVDAADATTEYSNRLQGLREQIREGAFGVDRDPDSVRYAALIEAVATLDAAEQARAAHLERAGNAADASAAMQQARDDAAQAVRDAAAAMAGNVAPSNAFTTAEQNLAEAERALLAFYGENSAEFQAFLAQKALILSTYTNAGVMEEAAAFIEGNEQLRQSLMTSAQARESEHQADIARMREHLATFAGTAEQRALIEEAIQERIKLVRQEAWAVGPMATAIAGWKNFGENLEQAAVGWLDGATSALADFIVTGEADWKGFLQNLAKEFTKLSLQWAMGNIFGALQGGAGGGPGPIMKFFGKLFGLAHDGAIVGQSTSHKSVSPANFIGASRFHTGGIVQDLAAGEVPIIAMEGEGVFTKEQMAHMGGSQQNIVVSTPITINANGGTSAQNDDLSKKIGKEIEDKMRSVVVSELRRQMRPGNMMGG